MDATRQTFKHASLKEVIICHALGHREKNLRRKDLLCIFSSMTGGEKMEPSVRKDSSNHGKRREIKFMYIWRRENPAYAHRMTFCELSSESAKKKVRAHLRWLHTKASLFHLWHRCVWTQPCVRQRVRCDVVGTVVPCAGSDYSLHVPTTPQPSPPSQHFTEQSKHGGQIRNRPYVLSAYSRIPAVGESHVWWGV